MVAEEAGNPLDQAPARSSFSQNALKVLGERYFRRDNTGVPVEDVDRMLARVAGAIAEPGRLYGDDNVSGRHGSWIGCRGASFSPTLPP